MSLGNLLRLILIISLILPFPFLRVDAKAGLPLPPVGQKITLSNKSYPIVINGFMPNWQDPSRMVFLFKPTLEVMNQEEMDREHERLLQYFLTALTVPSEHFWVNLSPYEENRVIAEDLKETLVGRDLLAQDYLLKQLMASLMDPQQPIGRKFWDTLYQEAFKRYGTTEIPFNTYHKVWVVADKAEVATDGQRVMLQEARLKVMLEDDYLALEKAKVPQKQIQLSADQGWQSQIIKEHLIPLIEEEVNHGEHFILLRQVYHALILGVWYKQYLLKCGLFGDYIDQSKLTGIEHQQGNIKQDIFNQYVQSFKKGIINRVIEEEDYKGQRIARKYFTGGFDVNPAMVIKTKALEEGLGDDFDQRGVRLMPINQPMAEESSNRAMTAKVQLNDQQRQQLEREVVSLINKFKATPSSKIVPFVFNHHTVTPFADSMYGGFQLLIALQDMLKSEGLRDLFNRAERIEQPVALSDVNILQIADTLEKIGILLPSERQVLIDAFNNIPEFFKQLNMEHLFNPRLKFQQIVEKIIQQRHPGLPRANIEIFRIEKINQGKSEDFIREGIKRNVLERVTQTQIRLVSDKKVESRWERLVSQYPEFTALWEELKMPLKINSEDSDALVNRKAGEIADQLMIDYGKQTKLIYQLIMKGLLRYYPGNKIPTDRLEDNDFQIVQSSSGLAMNNELSVFAASDEKPHFMITYKRDDFASRLEKEPELSMRLFYLSALYEVDIDPILLEVMTRTLTKSLVNDVVKKKFIELLRLNKPIANILFLIKEVGLLKILIPDFEHAHTVYGGSIHLLTLSNHTLYLFKAIEKIQQEQSDDKKMVKDIYGRLMRPDKADSLLTFRLGVLMHDLEKELEYINFGRPHHIGGANELVPKILRGFGVEHIMFDVQWLVRHHQTLSAMSRNAGQDNFYYHDLVELINGAGGSLTKDQFDQLVLITVADGSSIDPLYSPYKGKLNVIEKMSEALKPYFDASSEYEQHAIAQGWANAFLEAERVKIKDYLKRSISKQNYQPDYQALPFIDKEPYQEAVIRIMENEELRNKLFDEWAALMPFHYLIQITGDKVINQMMVLAMLREFKKQEQLHGQKGVNQKVLPLTSQVKRGDFSYFEIFVGIAYDKVGVLKELTGILALLGFNITDSKINTTGDRIIIDTFEGYFVDHLDLTVLADELNKMTSGKYQFNAELRSFLPTLLRAVFNQDISLVDIADIGGMQLKYKKFRAINNKTSVTFEDLSLYGSMTTTLMRVKTPERLGVLFAVFNTLARNGFNVETAQPTTPLDSDDIFYINVIDPETGSRRALTNKEKQNLSKELKALLDRETLTFSQITGTRTKSDSAMNSRPLGGIDLDLTNIFSMEMNQSCQESVAIDGKLIGMRPVILY